MQSDRQLGVPSKTSTHGARKGRSGGRRHRASSGRVKTDSGIYLSRQKQSSASVLERLADAKAAGRSVISDGCRRSDSWDWADQACDSTLMAGLMRTLSRGRDVGSLERLSASH